MSVHRPGNNLRILVLQLFIVLSTATSSASWLLRVMLEISMIVIEVGMLIFILIDRLRELQRKLEVIYILLLLYALNVSVAF